MKCLKQVQFIKIYISLERRAGLAMYMDRALRPYLGRLPMADMARACVIAYSAQTRYFRAVWDEGQKYLHIAAMRRLPMVVLAGRPYHIDPEVNHGIDRILCGMGAMVLSEDCLIPKYKKPPTNILNQWTYHSRLFGAAQYVARHPDNICLVQLVSFGCGVDAITTDEVRSILERQSQIYTQIKIDEITNPGAVRIRLRSLFSAMEARKELVP